MGGNFEGTAEGVIAIPVRLPAVDTSANWSTGIKHLRSSAVPHSRLTESQNRKLVAQSAIKADRDRREPHAEQYRDDSLRTLVSPKFNEPAEQPTATYHHRAEKGSLPAKQEPWPIGNQGIRAKLATMDPLVSQSARWDDPVIG